jgi:hypothetical protein
MKARYREQNAAEKSNFFWFKFFPFRNQGAMNSGTISIFFRTQLFFLWLYINAALFFCNTKRPFAVACCHRRESTRIATHGNVTQKNVTQRKRDAKERDA